MNGKLHMCRGEKLPRWTRKYPGFWTLFLTHTQVSQQRLDTLLCRFMVFVKSLCSIIGWSLSVVEAGVILRKPDEKIKIRTRITTAVTTIRRDFRAVRYGGHQCADLNPVRILKRKMSQQQWFSGKGDLNQVLLTVFYFKCLVFNSKTLDDMQRSREADPYILRRKSIQCKCPLMWAQRLDLAGKHIRVAVKNIFKD